MAQADIRTRQPRQPALSALALATCLFSPGVFGGPGVPPIAGTASGGGPGVADAQVTAYAAGLNPGDVAVELGSAMTDGNGDFDIPLMPAVTAGDLADGQLVYLVAIGGDAGSGVNDAISLMTAAGPFCDASQPGCGFPADVTIGEVSTVAAASILRDFITFVDCATIPNNSNVGTCVAIAGAAELDSRAATFDALVEVASGEASAFLANAADGTPINTTRRRLNTLGNILAGCVTGDGPGSAGCAELFDVALNSDDTLQAAFRIAHAPVINQAGDELFTLQTAPLTYTPALSAAPEHWTVGGQRFTLSVKGDVNIISVFRRSPANGVLTPVNRASTGGFGSASLARTPDRAFAYVTNQSLNQVSAFAVDPGTGAFTPVPGSPFPTGINPGQIDLSPDGTFAYVANLNGGTVSAYSIDPATGALDPVTAGGAGPCGVIPDPGNCFAAGTGPRDVTVASGGGHVYVVNLADDSVSAYSIDPVNGALAELAGSPLAAGNGPWAVALSADGAYAYVANFVGDDVSVYSIDASTGVPSPMTTGGAGACNGATPDPGNCFAAGNGPVAVGITADNGFAYVTNRDDNNISGYSIDAGSGALTALGTSPYATGDSPRSLDLTPGSGFAYVKNFSDDTLSGYAVNLVNGRLIEIDVASRFFADDDPRSIATGPGGAFAYVGNSDAGNVSSFAIDADTGAATEVAGSPTNADAGTRGIAADPDGRFVYAVNAGSGGVNSISGYRVDPATGGLDPLPGFPVNTLENPRAVTFAPDGDIIYVANANADGVSGYSVDPVTGALTELAGSPFSAGDFPASIAVTPGGDFAYVANVLSNAVSAFTIDAGGALSPITTGDAGTCGPNVGVDPNNCYDTPSASGVAVSHDGAFLHVANSNHNNVTVFTIDPVTGELSEIPDSPFAAGASPRQIAASPTGDFIFSANAGSAIPQVPGGISGFSVDSATGELTQVPGSPRTLGEFPLAVAVDPTGRFVYLTGGDRDGLHPTSNVFALTINPATGAFTRIDFASPFPLIDASGAEPEVMITPELIDFGEQPVLGNPADPELVMVENTGIVAVNLSGVSIAGPDAGDFTFQGDTCSGGVIDPLTACGFDVVFTPQAPGVRRAEALITSNAPGSPDVVVLTGTHGVIFVDGFEED